MEKTKRSCCSSKKAKELGEPTDDVYSAINRNVAELVESGEISAEDAWSLSA